MDGASKFVRGDAVAGIVITVVNVVGGILIGFFQRDMEITQALETYTILSIGDGLVTQVPSIIVSIAAGILVTRSSEEADLGEYVTKQLIVYPRAITIAGALLLLFSFFLYETFWPFFILSVACFVTAYFVKKRLDESDPLQDPSSSALTQSSGPSNVPSQSAGVSGAPQGVAEETSTLTPMESAIEQEVFGLEMGYGLLVLADKKRRGVDRITGACKFCPRNGDVITYNWCKDNIELDPNEYRFLLRGKEIVRSSVIPDRVLAMSMGGDATKLDGILRLNPFLVSVQPGSQRIRKEKPRLGLHSGGPFLGLVTHLSDVLKRFAYLILERGDTEAARFD